MKRLALRYVQAQLLQSTQSTGCNAEHAIVDRKGLEKRACECYAIIKQHLDDFAAFDTNDTK